MLSFVEWTEAIYSRKSKLEEIIDRMKYRKLQIRGPVTPAAITLPYNLITTCSESDEQLKAKYARDDILIKLNYEEDKLKREIAYIENVGEFPPEDALKQTREINT